MGIVDKWTCASWFRPSQFLEFQGEQTGRWRVVENPAYGHCGVWGDMIVYFLIAAAVAGLVFVVLVFALSYRGSSAWDVFAPATVIALPAGLGWPVSTLLIPVAVAGIGAWKLAQYARVSGQRRASKRVLRDAEDAKRTAELAPYIKQLEKELA